MNESFVKSNLALFTALILISGGCSHMMNFGKEPSVATDPAAAGDRSTKEIIELNRVVRQNSKSADVKKAHLKLARLHSSHSNRRRNYHKALQHLEGYILLEDQPADDEILNWLAALKKIDRLSKDIARVRDRLEKSKKGKLALKRTNRKLTREEIKLRAENRKLEESNQKLQKIIEMLKNLDQRFEEKKRNFNN